MYLTSGLRLRTPSQLVQFETIFFLTSFHAATFTVLLLSGDLR